MQFSSPVASRALLFCVVSCVTIAACSSSRDSAFDDTKKPAAASDPNLPAGTSTGFGPSEPEKIPTPSTDPKDCEEAAKARTYVGCDYWPTVTGNVVPDAFDFTVVVSNVGTTAADVHVTGPNGVDQTVSVPPKSLEKIFLPWVPALKGKGQNVGEDRQIKPFETSIMARKGAYHVVSSVPVVVYQFNPLEYRGQGGPPGKDWSNCPVLGEKGSGCYSYSNDASLLLPSTAWTGNYRVIGIYGWTSGGVPGIIPGIDFMGSYAAITAGQDGTVVKLMLGAKGKILAGDGITAADPNTLVEIALDAGDVAEIVTDKGEAYDLSGSLVQANHPIQIITGIQCINLPSNKTACDHVEEALLPAEALGRKYVVSSPTRPKGGPGLHIVRFVGNRDGTQLTYAPEKPEGCPDTLGAGEVADCKGVVEKDFVVTGTNEFAIASLNVGASVYEKPTSKAMGDPDETIFAAVEQFRTSYLFLTPDDYDVSYAVVVGPDNAAPILDGKPLTAFTPLAEGLGVWRATLGAGLGGGAHTLTSDQPVGLQAMGYGAYTSYQYPGGLNIKIISPPPLTK
jgi:hypothetical protein